MGKLKMFWQVVTISLLITSAVGGAPPVATRAFPVIAFWTVPEVDAAIRHLFGAGDLTSLDVRVMLYGAGRLMLWLVVISACWSMYGYFHHFYISARDRLALESSEIRRAGNVRMKV
jgi:CDP-diacylglycerol--glycerol-3-phosphate 3-phosphatidyltransferase